MSIRTHSIADKLLAEKEKERSKGGPTRKYIALPFGYNESPPPGWEERYATKAALDPANAGKNEEGGPISYDRTLVWVDMERYWNASAVRELYGEQWWILAQVSTRATAHVFFSAIFEYGIRVYFQVELADFRGVPDVNQFLPDKENVPWTYKAEAGWPAPDIQVTLVEAKIVYSTPDLKVVVRRYKLDEREGRRKTAYFNCIILTEWPVNLEVTSIVPIEQLPTYLRVLDETNRDLSAYDVEEQNQLHPAPPIVMSCVRDAGGLAAFIAVASIMRVLGSFGLQKAVPYPAFDAIYASPLLPEDSPFTEWPAAKSMHDYIFDELDSAQDQRKGMLRYVFQCWIAYYACVFLLPPQGRAHQVPPPLEPRFDLDGRHWPWIPWIAR